MSGMHDCPGGCGLPVPYRKLACGKCWYRLPLDMRRDLTAARGRDLRLVGDALIWYRENGATA